MLRSVLVLCAGLLAALCLGCVAAPPAPPSVGIAQPPLQQLPTITNLPRIARLCADATSFADHVFRVDPAFRPDVYGGNYVAPRPAADPITSGMRRDLIDAYTIAPDFFKAELCNLDGVFITAGGPWGFRERTDQNPARGRRYIGISAALWPSADTNASAITLSTFETQQLNRILGWDPSDGSIPPQYVPGISGPSIGTTPDTPGLAVLDALAHEVGHVRWYDVLVPNRDFVYHFDRLASNRCPTPAGLTPFFSVSWNFDPSRPDILGAPAWREYGGVADVRFIDHNGDPFIIDIYDSYHGNRPTGTILNNLYHIRRPWASYLASLSPDEDFVETYKLNVLLGSLQNLPLSITFGNGNRTSQQDIVADVNSGRKTALLNKLFCIQNMPSYNPGP